jgi:hypothetical protein
VPPASHFETEGSFILVKREACVKVRAYNTATSPR